MRNVAVDEAAAEALAAWQAGAVGIVVGHRGTTADKDHVLRVVRTPASDGAAAAAAGDGVAAINGLVPVWIGNHAGQVRRMLPGGLDVLGLALVGPTDALVSRATAANLRKVLMALDVPGEPLVLHACTTSRRVTCRAYALADREFAGKVTELKRQAALADSFQCLTAAFPVHLVAPSSGPRDWPARLQAALEAWASTVAVATPLLASGQNNDLLDDTVPASTAANCQLLFPILAPTSGGSAGAAVGPAGLVTVAGTVDLRAVVHQRDTVAVAAQAFAADLRRTVRARIELLVDEWQADDASDATMRQLQLPKRHVLERSPWFSDYVLLDDAEEDVRDRFATLLDTPLGSWTELACRERLPLAPKAAVPPPPTAAQKPAPAPAAEVTPPTPPVQWWWPVAGAVVAAVLAILLFAVIANEQPA